MLDWIFALALATFICVIAFLAWNKKATAHRNRDPNPAIDDPQSSSGEAIRPAEEIRASLDAAAHAPRRVVDTVSTQS
jgi:hypothetical protein